MKKIRLFKWSLCLLLAGCHPQQKNNETIQTKAGVSKIVGGGCDGCELMYVGMPTDIQSIDTSAGWNEKGQKLLVTGKVFQTDGATPAPNVIIYYWQTDANGYYSPWPGMDEKAKRHGHIRGWVKSDANGSYAIYTIRPVPYPNEQMPAHIHTSIKEPNIAGEYYIDEFVFDDDPLLNSEKRRKLENRGGSGILNVLKQKDLQVAEHDIVLGLNIPNYPKHQKEMVQSGLEIGERQPSFAPFHAFGPDKGSRACPVCKYGRYHGILYFVGEKPNWDDIRKWLLQLDLESKSKGKYLKVYFVYGNPNGYEKDARRLELEKIGTAFHLQKIALTFVPSLDDTQTDVNLNRVNPNVENTFIIYKNRQIVAKFINLKPTAQNFDRLSQTLADTKGKYFELGEPRHE